MNSGSPGSQSASEVQTRLRHALRAALQARDQAAVSALRSAQAAIGNAEAVAPPRSPAAGSPAAGSPRPGGNRHFAKSVEGLGAAEVPRRVLSEADAEEIIRTEISERHEAAELYERAGHADRAVRLRREADALTAALSADPV